MEYRQASIAGGIRFQTDPPVCNLCEREITRQYCGLMRKNEASVWQKKMRLAKILHRIVRSVS
jgi:hypothetical protein